MTQLILDLTRLLPGPLSTRLLGLMGYHILRLEGPQGDLMQRASPEVYAWLNAGKEIHSLDLKSRTGRKELERLTQDAVALVESNRPGVMERLGVGPERLRAVNPGLSYVRLAGFRNEASPGHDLTYLAEAGLLERLPWRSYQFADVAGAFWVALSVQQGILTGGGFYEVYLAEALRTLAYPDLPNLEGSVLCYTIYPTREGQIAIAALEEHLWGQFCAETGQEAWKGAAYSPAERANPLYQGLLDFFAQRSAYEWQAWAEKRDLPLRRVQSKSGEPLLPWKHFADHTP